MIGTERAAALELVELRLDHLEAGVDQIAGQRSVATRCLGDVPPVDQHVDETVAAIDAARHRPVRHRTRSIHRTSARETPLTHPPPNVRMPRRNRRPSTSPSRRSPTCSMVSPDTSGPTQRLPYTMCEQQCLDVPVLAGRGITELAPLHAGNDAASVVERSRRGLRAGRRSSRDSSRSFDDQEYRRSDQAAVCTISWATQR